MEIFTRSVAWLCQLDVDDIIDAPGICTQDDDFVGQINRLIDIVRDEQNRRFFFAPEDAAIHLANDNG